MKNTLYMHTWYIHYLELQWRLRHMTGEHIAVGDIYIPNPRSTMDGIKEMEDRVKNYIEEIRDMIGTDI